MSALTTRLSLYKPGGGSTGLITPDETVDIDKINSNMDLIDAAIGFKVCTSASRPASPFTGQPIYETDTKQFRTWDGAAWVTDASSRGTASGYTVASLAALDAISDAVIGDTAAFTAAPSAGISSTSAALMAQAYSGSGASIKWHFTVPIIAATLANMDTFIAACVAITDLATAFIVGQTFFVLDTKLFYRFTSTAGGYVVMPGRIVPSAVTNGSFNADTGVMTSSAQTEVRARDVFLTGFSMFRVAYDVTMSAAAGPGLRLASGWPASDSITEYDSERITSINATGAEVQTLNGNKFELSAISVAGARHVGQFTLINPNVGGQTFISGTSTVVSPTAMTTSTGGARIEGFHRTAASYDSLTLLAPSGTITVNRWTIEGVS